MNSYILSRQWFDFAFESSSKVKPIHGSIYFWIIELANRLGWPAEFGNPGSQCMAACGISSYNTYKKAFDELKEWGFIEVKRKSINQYSSCIIALLIIDKAPYKALDKALSEHYTKHSCSTIQSTIQSTDSIIKPSNLEPLTSKPETEEGASLFPTPENEVSEIPLKAEKEKKATHTGPAKKEKATPHFFEESPYYDLQKFLEYFSPIQYPRREFPDTDIEHYHRQLRHWAEYGSGQKPGKQTAKDWLGTARTFMKNDIEKDKLKLKAKPNLTITKNEPISDDAYTVKRFVA